jgi:vacuolar-type H+-ATPase subunit E/Vma4
VVDLAWCQWRFDMREQAHDPRHGANHVEFLGTEQWYVVDAQGAGSVGRKLRSNVAGRREYDADDVVGGEVVSLKHGADQLDNSLEQVLPLVNVELSRPANRPYRH